MGRTWYQPSRLPAGEAIPGRRIHARLTSSRDVSHPLKSEATDSLDHSRGDMDRHPSQPAATRQAHGMIRKRRFRRPSRVGSVGPKGEFTILRISSGGRIGNQSAGRDE